MQERSVTLAVKDHENGKQCSHFNRNMHHKDQTAILASTAYLPINMMVLPCTAPKFQG